MLFDIWGQPLDRTIVAGINGPVTAYVNGAQYDGDLRAIPLTAHQQITLEVGTPIVPPPNYVFPPGGLGSAGAARSTLLIAALSSWYEISPLLRYATLLSLPMTANVGKPPCK